MTEADLSQRIRDNLTWSLIVDADRPLTACAARFDVWAELQKVWNEPDDKFVEALYLLLLARPADSEGSADIQQALADGVPRVVVVRTMATSMEAQIGGLDVSWLSQLAAPPAQQRKLFSLATLKALIRRVVRRVHRLGGRWTTARAASRPSRSGGQGPCKGGS